MSAVRTYLEALRREQLGEPVGDLEALRRHATATNKAAVRGRRPKPPVPRAELHVGTHARRRLAQMSIKVSDVDLIWRYGESRPQRDGRRVHVITRGSLTECGRKVAKTIRGLEGIAIIVAPPELATVANARHAVITVIPGQADRVI